MVVFFLGAWVTMKYIWPPLIHAIEERQKKIADGLSAANKGEKALAIATEQGKAIEADARARATTIVSDGEKRAQSIVDEAKAQAQVEADRIIDADITLRRTVQYGLKQNPTADEAWHYQRFHKHLMEKYAPDGYLKLWFPDSKNAGRLKELQTIIADEIRLRSIFHQMFEEEKR